MTGEGDGSTGFEIPGIKLGTQAAAEDLTEARYRFVKQNTAGGIVRADTAGERVLGVLQSPAEDGSATEIMRSGVSKVVAGAAMATSGEVTTDTQGRVVLATTPGHRILGVSHETAGGAGEIVAVSLEYRGVVPAE